ncbi:hypothetical protein [Gordonia sp. SND2]|uniref:DUF7368 family protein n=1 Tax=Gordonia sp. SND2 TaxID=3388659 RepID=UPI00398B8B28
MGRNLIPIQRTHQSALQAANQGLADAHELIEIVHDCDPDYVWDQLSEWGPTRAAIAAIILAAAHRTDDSLTDRLDWVRDLPNLQGVA